MPSMSYSQDVVNQLVDSLVLVTSSQEKARISQQIAQKLKNKDWKRTLHYLEYARKEARASGSDETLMHFFTTAADIYYDKDVLDVALDYYQKAYNLYRQTNDEGKKFDLENDLAVIYARLKNKDKALYYFTRVYRYHAQKKDSFHLAKILNNIGTLFLEEDVDSSEVYYLKSLKIAEGLDDIELNAYLYTNLGRVYSSKQELQTAQSYFEKSIALTETNLEEDTKQWIFKLTSEYFLKGEQIDSAIYYANKAVDFQRDNNYSFTYLDAIRTLYKAYLVKEDYKNASVYFELYDSIRDSINVEETAVNVERLKLEQEYKTKEQIKTLEENQKELRYLIVGLSLTSGLLILLMLLLRYKNKLSKARLGEKLEEAKKEELKANLELKNRTLIAKAMKEMHRTEIIHGILENLKRVKLRATKKETQHAIDYVLMQLEKDINTNIWKEFEVSFEQVHEAFYNNLNKEHPNLTPKERRLCALLILNLSSKEIGQITGQSFKAVENARTRLRKKLELTNTKSDLVAYLNKFN